MGANLERDVYMFDIFDVFDLIHLGAIVAEDVITEKKEASVQEFRDPYEVYKSQEEERNRQLLQKTGWKCSCGKFNATYVGTCACGKRKDEV